MLQLCQRVEGLNARLLPRDEGCCQIQQAHRGRSVDREDICLWVCHRLCLRLTGEHNRRRWHAERSLDAAAPNLTLLTTPPVIELTFHHRTARVASQSTLP